MYHINVRHNSRTQGGITLTNFTREEVRQLVQIAIERGAIMARDLYADTLKIIQKRENLAEEHYAIVDGATAIIMSNPDTGRYVVGCCDGEKYYIAFSW